MTPSMFPNMEDSPRLKSIPKKSTAHTGAPGMCSTASVKTMKAKPGPEAPYNTHIPRCGHWPGPRGPGAISPFPAAVSKGKGSWRPGPAQPSLGPTPWPHDLGQSTSAACSLPSVWP